MPAILLKHQTQDFPNLSPDTG